MLFKGWQGADRPAARDLAEKEVLLMLYFILLKIKLELKMNLKLKLNSQKKPKLKMNLLMKARFLVFSRLQVQLKILVVLRKNPKFSIYPTMEWIKS